MALTPQQRSELASKASSGPHDRLWRRHPTGICGIPGCGRKHYMKDLCGMHHARWAKTGNTGPVGLTRERKETYGRSSSTPTVARKREMPTEAARKAASAKVRSVVTGERARRIRKLAMYVDACGTGWNTVVEPDGKRYAVKKDGGLLEFDDGTASTLSASGWLHEDGRGACRLTRAGEEAVSLRTVEAGAPSPEPVDEGSSSPRGEQAV